ncbi:MAG: hypothetical protein AVDCRST_MAG59-1586, partial [uncultured Thermomicrobiales bacterium]
PRGAGLPKAPDVPLRRGDPRRARRGVGRL